MDTKLYDNIFHYYLTSDKNNNKAGCTDKSYLDKW